MDAAREFLQQPVHGQQRVPSFTSLPEGVGTAFQLAIEFHLWWESKRVAPTWQDIVDRFNVTRSTAYRWRASYLAAIGKTNPPNRKRKPK